MRGKEKGKKTRKTKDNKIVNEKERIKKKRINWIRVYKALR